MASQSCRLGPLTSILLQIDNVYTQCVHCETLFRIQPEQLRAAHGLVRCTHCNEVFNALDHLHEREEHPSASAPIGSAALIPVEPPLARHPTEGLPPHRSPFQRLLTTLLWSLSLLILSALALLQLAWFQRDTLIEHDHGRGLLEYYCHYAGCTLPPRRALEQLKIIERMVASHPEIPNILRIALTFENQAPFHQPFPTLQVSLFTQDGELQAQRRFAPEEYSDDPLRVRDLMQPGQTMAITLDIHDPGSHVTGFEFAFF